MYNGPGQTRLIAPEDGDRPNTHACVGSRRVVVSGELVRIEFEVFRDAEGEDLVIASGSIDQPEDGTRLARAARHS